MMQPLTDKDYELIAEAQRVIRLNYDAIHENHTVGAAVRSKSGKIFAGVNMYSMHGACAEQIAIGAAVTQGERDFDTIVAVRGKDGSEIIPPCGNMPDCEVILSVAGQHAKIKAKELLPFSYTFEG